MRDFAKLFKVLSDETKIRILKVLLETECCVCEVMQVLGVSQSTASRDLGALYDAGFLNRRREGTWASFSINTESIAEYYLEIIGAMKETVESNEMYKSDRERLKEVGRVGPHCAGQVACQN
jgi:ArsR family transcriptional regulator